MADRQAVSFAGYLDPTVRDRLINYYASDPVYESVQKTLAIPDLVTKITIIDELAAYFESIKWYDGVSQEVFDLVDNRTILIQTAESLSGKIVSEYFNKLTDLVTIRDSLVWYGQPVNLSDLVNLQQKSGQIRTTSDFINSTTVDGKLRLSMLQQYLGDDWYNKLGGLISQKPSIDGVVSWLTATKQGSLDGILVWLTTTKETSVDHVLGWLTATKETDLNDIVSWKSPLQTIKDWLDSTRRTGLDDLLTRRPSLVDLSNWHDGIGNALNGIFAKTGGRFFEAGKGAGGTRFGLIEGDYINIFSDTHETFDFMTANLGGVDPHLRGLQLFTEDIGGNRFVSTRIKGRLYGERTVLQVMVDPGIYPVAPIDGQVFINIKPGVFPVIQLMCWVDGKWRPIGQMGY